MNYKIGDKLNVIIPGFSPTIARIDNIVEKNGEMCYHISFQEEHLYTICRVVSERVLEEMIATYDKNRDNLEPFMLKKDTDDAKPEKQPDKEDTGNHGSDINMVSNVSDAFDVETKTDVNFTVGKSPVHLTSQKE